MPPEVIAIVSAMGWAGDGVLVRMGARTSNIYAAAFLSYSVAAAARKPHRRGARTRYWRSQPSAGSAPRPRSRNRAFR